MGKRSRRRDLSAGYARAEERNEAVRQSLEPLGPGEVPGAVKIAAVVSLLLATANTVSLIAGETVTGSDATVSGLGLSLVLVVAAVFMWRGRYWAVLGFQALLAIQIIICAASLIVVNQWWAALVLVALMVLGGWLFWKLVRALARLQMPAR